MRPWPVVPVRRRSLPQLPLVGCFRWVLQWAGGVGQKNVGVSLIEGVYPMAGRCGR
jgi:hypothetical protein